jgi:hypothetical protein
MGFFDFIKKFIPWSKPLVETTPSRPRATPTPAAPPLPPRPTLKHENWLMSGDWLHMASSNVEMSRYLWDTSILEVAFKGENRQGEGYWYQYFDVPAAVADAFAETASPGRFVWNHLRDRYPYVRLSGFPSAGPRTPTVVRTPSDTELARKGLVAANLPEGLVPTWLKHPSAHAVGKRGGLF